MLQYKNQLSKKEKGRVVAARVLRAFAFIDPIDKSSIRKLNTEAINEVQLITFSWNSFLKDGSSRKKVLCIDILMAGSSSQAPAFSLQSAMSGF
jgi:hypothetical protein